jgi:PAS domain S-box-containing protein
VLCILLIKQAFSAQLGPDVPFLLLFVPPMISAWYGGTVAGMITVAASALGVSVLFLPPLTSGWISGPTHLLRLGAFIGEGAAIVLITAKMRQARSQAQFQAAQAQEARQQLDAILQGVDVGISVQDAAGRLVYANQVAARMTGFPSPEAMLATPVAQLMQRFELRDEAGAPLPLAQLPGRRALAGVRSERTVRFRILETGEERWSLVKGIPIRDGAGPTRFALNVFEDITERKLAEDALRISKEWLATTLRSIGDGVVATDEAGRVTFLNPVAEQLIGWSAEEAQGRPLADLFVLVQERGRQRIEGPVEEVLRGGVIVGLASDTVLVRRDGSEIAIDDSAAPIRAPGGAGGGARRGGAGQRDPLPGGPGRAGGGGGGGGPARAARQHRQPRSAQPADRDHDVRRGAAAALGDAEERAVGRIAASAGRMREMIEQLLDMTRASTGSGIPITPRVMRLDTLCRAG